MSKTGNEFAVDVVVSSFVIEGDIFYTGIITEVNRGGGLVRNQSLSALSTETEIREKHQKVSHSFNHLICHQLCSGYYTTVILHISLFTGNGYWCTNENFPQVKKC